VVSFKWLLVFLLVSLVLLVGFFFFCILIGFDIKMFFIIAGIAIGITGDAGVRATAQQPRMFVGMVRAGTIH
jgi:hypothetical protein